MFQLFLKNILLLSALLNNIFLVAQISSNNSIVNPKKYEFRAVYDSTYGIISYNNLIISIGGDSIRVDQNGRKVQGWIEDFYTSGSTLHKGYYVDGKIRVFKNFYPEGKIERTFKLNDAKRSEMTIYYSNDNIKSKIEYFNETVVHQEDYFDTGIKEYEEVFDKSGLILWKKISFLPNGMTEVSLEVTDKKKKKYLQQEFYPNGKIKCEGELKLNMVTFDFVKEGEWNYFNEIGGVVKSENYNKGELLNK